jgi:hypothetical protein
MVVIYIYDGPERGSLKALTAASVRENIGCNTKLYIAVKMNQLKQQSNSYSTGSSQ